MEWRWFAAILTRHNYLVGTIMYNQADGTVYILSMHVMTMQEAGKDT
jgi:hypothetical protein